MIRTGFLQFIVSLAVFISSFAVCPGMAYAQFQPDKTRILFLLDGSGSMNGQWLDKSKFETAKEVLVQLADSIEKSGKKVEFAVRVFGHQFPRSAHNCTDTKLEVSFAGSNAAGIKAALEKITPQGYTPIALSLKEAANDFPKDDKANNAIVLITDGEESCEGIPCNAVDQLVKNRIALKPYIISLSKDVTFENLFPCKEQFFVAETPDQLSNTAAVVIAQTMQPTTVQLNLLDKFSKATVTNIPVSFIDHYSQKTIYSFVHAMKSNGLSDTVQIDPRGVYDVIVHTVPEIRKTSVEINAGRHNIVAIDVPVGKCEVINEKDNRIGLKPKRQVVVRQSYNTEILSVQDVNDTSMYLSDDYDVQVLATPLVERKLFWVEKGKYKNLNIPDDGKLVVLTTEAGHLGVFAMIKGNCKTVWQSENCLTREELELQPGSYWVVYRKNKGAEADFTKSKSVEIISDGQTIIKF